MPGTGIIVLSNILVSNGPDLNLLADDYSDCSEFGGQM